MCGDPRKMLGWKSGQKATPRRPSPQPRVGPNYLSELPPELHSFKARDQPASSSELPPDLRAKLGSSHKIYIKATGVASFSDPQQQRRDRRAPKQSSSPSTAQRELLQAPAQGIPSARRRRSSSTATVSQESLPTVQEILSARARSFSKYYHRWTQHDTPLASVYRIYIALLSGQEPTIRNEIEHFWNQDQWTLSAIPEPTIQDSESRAVLAAITYLLVKAFNRLIERGMPRDAPAIMSQRMMEEMESRPKKLEQPPKWARDVHPLTQQLLIPDSRGAVPRDSQDLNVDTEMLKKNIITLTVPVFFA